MAKNNTPPSQKKNSLETYSKSILSKKQNKSDVQSPPPKKNNPKKGCKPISFPKAVHWLSKT